MKILCISKKGKLEHYVKDPAFYKKYEIISVSIDASDEAILEAGRDADFIIIDAITKLSDYVISNMPNLKLIHSEGVAYNGIDLESASRNLVYVCNCKGMNATAVAEQEILLILGLLKNVITGDAAVRCGHQIDVKTEYMMKGSLREIADCTIGFIGFGDIAKATAKIIHAFGGKMLYYKPHPLSEEEEQEYHVTYQERNELLSNSDIISLNTPVTPETFHMADEGFFKHMKEGSMLINAGRGELVDTEALLAALRSGKLSGAGLDTIEGEPVQQSNSILNAEKEVEDKILFSPHIGGITASSFRRGFQIIVSNIEKAASGEQPINIVNNIKN